MLISNQKSSDMYYYKPLFQSSNNNNQNCMIKLVHGKKNKIVKLDKSDFSSLRTLIRQSFSDVPVDYTLSYVDQDKDEICLNSDEDLRIMLGSGAKVTKVYIKQSLSQTIEITDRIEPSFEVEDSGVRIVEVEKEGSPLENVFKKGEEKTFYEFEEVRMENRDKEIYVQAPLVKEEIKPQEEPKVEAEVKPEPVHKASEEMEKQQEKAVNKSFVISVSDNKVEIEESILNEKIGEIVKKMIESKEEGKKETQVIAKKEQVKEEKKVEVPIQVKVEDLPRLQGRPPSFSELIYHNVICSNCKDEYGIIGIRYQCIFCDDFNLCQGCEQKTNHVHALLKVKQPKQEVKKEDIITKYRNDIFVNRHIPQGNYIPSISRDEANRFIDTSKNMINDSIAGAQRMLNDMFMKLQLSHQNPYEVINPPVGQPKYYPAPFEKPPVPDSKEALKKKVDYLCNLFSITEREAQVFCAGYHGFSKEQLAELYINRREKK